MSGQSEQSDKNWKNINKKSVFNYEQMKKSIKNIVSAKNHCAYYNAPRGCARIL